MIVHDCSEKHDKDYICRLILRTATNILLKTLCLRENDTIIKERTEKKNLTTKRKLETLKK